MYARPSPLPEDVQERATALRHVPKSAIIAMTLASGAPEAMLFRLCETYDQNRGSWPHTLSFRLPPDTSIDLVGTAHVLVELLTNKEVLPPVGDNAGVVGFQERDVEVVPPSFSLAAFSNPFSLFFRRRRVSE
uniref:Uncharacterized protein n=1 Tax=Chromera velia CCMP2878 TaxID=1169474 RepID=A0A0G4HFN3_9ALVE|eukprot:Cvel_27136.t1-p1 / transcript=Cvel_27136.t1 / gene=Cvel_27136 / organism=Chromera_velia_CCMP2878 / gene_product=hypothetical protein / transcript_product=hypothetical protein / location=Cvel_scaffold3336:6403-7975(-) / protein_length=132 / sequence_SO=supercontig / SO=protein_coding / is_pseudo=false